MRNNWSWLLLVTLAPFLNESNAKFALSPEELEIKVQNAGWKVEHVFSSKSNPILENLNEYWEGGKKRSDEEMLNDIIALSSLNQHRFLETALADALTKIYAGHGAKQGLVLGNKVAGHGKRGKIAFVLEWASKSLKNFEDKEVLKKMAAHITLLYAAEPDMSENIRAHFKNCGDLLEYYFSLHLSEKPILEKIKKSHFFTTANFDFEDAKGKIQNVMTAIKNIIKNFLNQYGTAKAEKKDKAKEDEKDKENKDPKTPQSRKVAEKAAPKLLSKQENIPSNKKELVQKILDYNISETTVDKALEVTSNQIKRFNINDKITLLIALEDLLDEHTRENSQQFLSIVKESFSKNKQEASASDYINFIDGLSHLGKHYHEIFDELLSLIGRDFYLNLSTESKVSLLGSMSDIFTNCRDDLKDIKDHIQKIFSKTYNKSAYDLRSVMDTLKDLSLTNSSYERVFDMAREAVGNDAFFSLAPQEQIHILKALNKAHKKIDKEENQIKFAQYIKQSFDHVKDPKAEEYTALIEALNVAGDNYRIVIEVAEIIIDQEDFKGLTTNEKSSLLKALGEAFNKSGFTKYNERWIPYYVKELLGFRHDFLIEDYTHAVQTLGNLEAGYDGVCVNVREALGDKACTSLPFKDKTSLLESLHLVPVQKRNNLIKDMKNLLKDTHVHETTSYKKLIQFLDKCGDAVEIIKNSCDLATNNRFFAMNLEDKLLILSEVYQVYEKVDDTSKLGEKMLNIGNSLPDFADINTILDRFSSQILA